MFKINDYNKINMCITIQKLNKIKENYFLMDTNAILYILKTYRQFEHITSIYDFRLTTPLHIIDETIHHHEMSLKKGGRTVERKIINHIENLKKIINTGIMMIYIITDEILEDFKRFSNDACLHYSMQFLGLKHICSQDPEITSLYKKKVIIPERFYDFISRNSTKLN